MSNVFPICTRCESHSGTCTLPFEMMDQEENINKCLPPSTFRLPFPPGRPRSGENHSFTCDTLPGQALNMFLELNDYQPCRQDKFPNWLLSQHLHIVFYPGRCSGGCQAEVSCGGIGFRRSSLAGRWERKSGRVDVQSKTNSVTSKPWQKGLSVSQLSSQMLFKAFFCFLLALLLFFFLFAPFWSGVCVSVLLIPRGMDSDKVKGQIKEK